MAHIYYELIDAAQSAIQEMREFPLVGPHRRLRIDFADVEVEESTVDEAGRRSCSSKYNVYPDASRGGEEPLNRHRSRGSDISSTRSGLTSSLSVADLSQKAPRVWDGGLEHKNSLFPTKFHLIEGDREVIDGLSGEDKNNLKITQRLRLDQSKLDDVTKRMYTGSSHAVFLGMSSYAGKDHSNSEVQSRPLRNLISYLKRKVPRFYLAYCCCSNNHLRVVTPNETESCTWQN